MKNRRAPQGRSWKYAFLLLLFFNLFVFIWAYLSLFSYHESTDTEEISKGPVTDLLIQAEVTLNEADLEALLFKYLVEMEQDPITNVEVKDHVLITGELEILGFPIEYMLDSEPFVVENGDIQLKVEKITLGSLSLPISQILQILNTQLSNDLPLQIDSEENHIDVLLTEIHNDILKGIKLLKIDKEKQEYTFEITMNKENLLQ